MGSFVKAVYDTIKVFILFTTCTILFYYGIVWLNEEYRSYQRYDEPKGSSVKVSTFDEETETNWWDRLIQFYLNGE
ncbi:DUF4227 family protein [Bacillus sp. HMF5848]|uniref:YqzK family protein n=1 Tax=Bacillus sp. HMF5848 TaxID=2495421 RepID=UPI000F7B2C1A|nr:YqzK family protein [Bacillus sp. HMF5848]RSK27715.1 DUF4227 family protein [Bacillus sp. HMF5848]